MVASKAIPVDRLDKYWELIAPFLHWTPKMGWDSNEILEYLRTEQGYLHVIYEEDRCVGMFIVSYLGDELHITIAQTFDYHLKSLYNALMTIVALGKEYGCSKVSFETTRPGWRKVAKKLGFVQTEPLKYERLI